MITETWQLNSLALLGAYLLGSIPSAVWISRIFYGKDIRSAGSGNPGMTNVIRVFGWKPAVPVTLIDSLKGTAACWLCDTLTGSFYITVLAGLFAVLGHSFTCFARFKGGKGVLTAMGVFLYLSPFSSLSCLGLWFCVVWFTRYFSLSSIAAAIGLPIFVFFENYQENSLKPLLFLSLTMSLFVIVRHRTNIQRLWRGTEKKFAKGQEKRE